MQKLCCYANTGREQVLHMHSAGLHFNTTFSQLVLDPNVLDLAMRFRKEPLVLDNNRNNKNFRHAAYRQYVLWQHGRLARGNRRVVLVAVWQQYVLALLHLMAFILSTGRQDCRHVH